MIDAVFNLSSVTVVLPLDAGRVPAALGGSCLVDATDRLNASMLAGDHLLATISQLLFIPHNGFQKPLQGSRGYPLIHGNRLGVLPLNARQQPSHVDLQQLATSRPRKTTCETCQELGKHSSQFCDILDTHGTTFRGFRVRRLDTRKVVPFSLPRQDQ